LGKLAWEKGQVRRIANTNRMAEREEKNIVCASHSLRCSNTKKKGGGGREKLILHGGEKGRGKPPPRKGGDHLPCLLKRKEKIPLERDGR